ncbi:MAG: hypothetical protein ACREQX_05750 [Candidatus Binataceae bacterium]
MKTTLTALLLILLALPPAAALAGMNCRVNHSEYVIKSDALKGYRRALNTQNLEEPNADVQADLKGLNEIYACMVEKGDMIQITGGFPPWPRTARFDRVKVLQGLRRGCTGYLPVQFVDCRHRPNQMAVVK